MNSSTPQKKTAGLIALLLFAALGWRPAFGADALDSAINARVKTQAEAAKTQQKIDTLADETSSMLEQYKQVLHQTQDLRTYNDQLQKLVDKQNQQIASFTQQMVNARNVQQQIVPFMLRMVHVLGQFIKLDAPFLQHERKTRLANLKKLMDDPNVSLSDKYRRIMEAYQVEAEYGRTIEAYTGQLKLNGQTRTVNFLRIGRVALLYLTFDRSEGGYWDQQAREWKKLPRDYFEAVAHGMQIARKEAPPDLIKVPVPAPQQAKAENSQ